MPAKAVIQNNLILLDSRFHGNDTKGASVTFYETVNIIFPYKNRRKVSCRIQGRSRD